MSTLIIGAGGLLGAALGRRLAEPLVVGLDDPASLLAATNLVWLAGGPTPGRLIDCSIADWDHLLGGTLEALWSAVRKAAPALVRSRGALVVVVPTGMMLRRGLSMLVNSLAAELAGVRVRLIEGVGGEEAVAEAVEFALNSRATGLSIGLSAPTPPIVMPAKAGIHGSAGTNGAMDASFRWNDTKGRVALITGGAGAIGQALGEALQASGPARLLLVDTDDERLSQAAKALREHGATVETLQGDMADPALPQQAVAQALTTFGRLDAVYSHAGIGEGAKLLDATQEAWTRSFAINVRATWLLAQAAREALKASHGALIATASVAAHKPGASAPLYSVSKATLLGLTEQLAFELAGEGIRVNAVSPGSTLTPMNRLWGASDEERARHAAMIPLQRMAAPEEIAAAMAFLGGPGGSYVTGQVLAVDGGLSLGG